MKKTLKRLLASCLVVVMFLASAPLGEFNFDWDSLFSTKVYAASSGRVEFSVHYYEIFTSKVSTYEDAKNTVKI